MTHPDPHTLAGLPALLRLAPGPLPAAVVTVEDWWGRETGIEWADAWTDVSSDLVRAYARRLGGLPTTSPLLGYNWEDIVLVVDVEGTHHAVHTSELHPHVEDDDLPDWADTAKVGDRAPAGWLDDVDTGCAEADPDGMFCTREAHAEAQQHVATAGEIVVAVWGGES